MKRDYSNVPTSKVVKNITEDKIKFDLRDNWKQVPVEIEPNDSIEITVETSEAMALLESKVEELGLEMTDGGTTPVEVPVESVSLNENTANLFVGQTLTLVATITPENATNKQCTWSSTDDTKATVVDGVVTAKAVGNVVISVETVDGNKTASCDVTITIAEVADETSLRDAISNGASDVKVTDNITVPSGNLDITGVTHFDGNNKTITFETTGQNFVARDNATIENVIVENTVATEDWSSTYGIQCYNGTYTIKNCTAKGGNAGILVNSSNVTLEGTIDVSSNKFGGIEVSKSSSPDLPNATLNVNGATILNATEEYGKPTIWTDGEGQMVNGAEAMFTNSEVKEGQVQYYLLEENSRDNINVNLEQKLQAFKEKYYNKFSNKKITTSDADFDSSLVYVNLGNVNSTVDTITVNDETIDSTVVGVSIGNNAFLRAPLFKVEDNVLYVSTVLLVTFAVDEEIKVIAGDNTKYVKDSNIMPSTILPISNVYALNTKEGYTNTVQASDNNTVITQTAGYGTSAVGVTLQSDGTDILDSQVVYVYRTGLSIGISTPERMDNKDVTFAYYAKYMNSAYTEEETKEFNFVIYVPDSGIAQFNLTVNCIVETVDNEAE